MTTFAHALAGARTPGTKKSRAGGPGEATGGRAQRSVRTRLLGLALGLPMLAFAAPHEHGVAHLDIVVEPGAITIQIDSPLANLLGFERAPRTDTERRAAEAMVARLRSADALFRIDPAAGCVPGAVGLSSAALGLGDTAPAGAADEHADLDGSFSFRCQDGRKAAFIEQRWFEAFDGMQRLEVQVVTPTDQLKRTLTRPLKRIGLTR